MEEAYVSTEAIVVKRTDFKENDGIYTLYTKELGKIGVMAKGVKKNSSKLRGGLTELAISDVTLLMGKGMPIVVNAQTREALLEIRYELVRMSYAAFCMEFLDRVVVEQEADAGLYALVCEGLRMIAAADPWVGSVVTVNGILEHMGYGAAWSECAVCGKRDSAAVYGSSEGILCAECAGEAGKKVLLSPESVAVLKGLHYFKGEMLRVVYASKRAQKELNRYLALRMENVLERELKSYSFLKSMGII